MKFGEYLDTNKNPAWADSYLDYNKLKKMIKALEQQLISRQTFTGQGTSLSVPTPTNAAGIYQILDGKEELVTQEMFYTFLESEMKKIEIFTKEQVLQIRKVLSEVESSSQKAAVGEAEKKLLWARVEEGGHHFLLLEKYVNLNFTGFHKILKKHGT
jgi:SPX domain protein involved in polyphosphate accumulation